MEFGDRPNLSASLAERIREMITDGTLVDGERVNEVHLADQLGVSRTPLREALARLTAEGAMISSPRRGFFVAPLTEEELRQIYPIRAILDPEALRMAGIPSLKAIDRLERVNARLRGLRDPKEVLQCDDEWHLLLLAHCPNRVIVGLIEQFIWRTRRYELALMRDRTNLIASTDQHDSVVAALRKGDLDAACRALRSNMEGGLDPLLAWLQTRNERNKVKEA